jgi:hypothetical protein
VADPVHIGGAALLGQFMASTFVATGAAFGGGPIADAQSSPQPFLVQPHIGA